MAAKKKEGQSVDDILNQMGIDVPDFKKTGLSGAAVTEKADVESDPSPIRRDEKEQKKKAPESPSQNTQTPNTYSAQHLFNPLELDDVESEIETAYRDVKETIDIQYRMLLMKRIEEAGLRDNFTAGFAQVTHEQFSVASENPEVDDIEHYLYANRDSFYAAVDTDQDLTQVRLELNAELNTEALNQESRVTRFVQDMAREEAEAGRPENADKIINRFESMGRRGVYDKMAISAKFEESFPNNTEHNHKNFLDTIKSSLKDTLLSDNPNVRIGLKTAMLAASCAASAGFPPLAIISAAGIAKEVLKLPSAEPVREVINDTAKKVKDIVANIPMVGRYLKSKQAAPSADAESTENTNTTEAEAPKSRRGLILAGVATAFVAGATLFADPSLDKVAELGSSLKELGYQALGMASEVAHTASEHAADIASTVSDQVSQFADDPSATLTEWGQDALRMVADAADSISEQSREWADSLTDTAEVSANETISEGSMTPAADPVIAVPESVEIDIPKGSSLWSISEQILGEGATNAEIVTKINEIAELNGIENPDRIMAGDALKLPVADLQELERIQVFQPEVVTPELSEGASVEAKEPEVEARDIYDAEGSEPPLTVSEADWAELQGRIDEWSHEAAEQYTKVFESKFGELPSDVRMQLYADLQTSFADIDDIAKSTIGPDGILHEDKLITAVSNELPDRAMDAFKIAMDSMGVQPEVHQVDEAYQAALDAHGGSIAGKGSIDLGNGVHIAESSNHGMDFLLDEEPYGHAPKAEEAGAINLNNLDSLIDKGSEPAPERTRDDVSLGF